ncbi:hypothetical protein N8762_00190 [Candidatus Marinamargulisbacteria bacterium]|nr:hypothetical protein [bacterium]MDA7563891.1 hypothetical protein [Candidatus Marinamargulisbacteria bacterium]|tara:strand:- start:98 stop:3322 length:3225 start_codon:yes stop_codon:yes gene_type:complete
MSVKPLVSKITLPISLNRSMALDQANELTKSLGIGPNNYQQTAVFRSNKRDIQYVDWQVSVNNHTIKHTPYEPFWWEIRHLDRQTQHELRIYLRANGELYGFSERNPAEALHLKSRVPDAGTVSKQLTQNWGVDLSHMQWQGCGDTPKTRYTCRYQYNQSASGYHQQIELVVSVKNTTIAGFHYRLVIPDQFLDQYQLATKTHQLISLIGRVGFGLFYGVIGCFFGLAFLIKRGYLIWKKPIVMGVFLSALLGVSNLNLMPIRLHTYNPLISHATFLIELATQYIGSFVFWLILFSLALMVAESLTRKAFENRIQLWQLLSSRVVSSPSVFGRIMGGYLLGILIIGYTCAFNQLLAPILSGWTPSNLLIHQSILSSYFPGISPIIHSIGSSLWQECLFRAIPLAGAALLGKRLGYKKLWIGSALLAQAFIYSAFHGIYTTASIPAYMYTVKLVVPALLLGGVYLRFGLLPIVIAQFIYSISLYSVPLFTVIDQHTLINQIIIILGAASPILYAIAMRLKQGDFSPITDAVLNKAWQPSGKTIYRRLRPIEAFSYFKTGKLYAIGFFSILGVGIWLTTTPFTANSPSVSMDRQLVSSRVQAILQSQNIEWQSEWKLLMSMRQSPGLLNQFLMEHALDAHAFRHYTAAPYWRVRVVETRDQLRDLYAISLGANGELVRFKRMTTPEAFGGASHSTLIKESIRDFGYTDKHPFGVAKRATKIKGDTQHYQYVLDHTNVQKPFNRASLVLNIANNHIIDTFQLLKMPKQWVYKAKTNASIRSQLLSILKLIYYSAIFAVFIFSIYSWQHHYFSYRVFYSFLAGLLMLNTIMHVNQYPEFLFQMINGKSWSYQLVLMNAKAGIFIIIESIVLSVIAGFIHHGSFRRLEMCLSHRVLLCGGVTFIALGLLSFAYYIQPNTFVWADYSAINTYSTVVAAIVSPIRHYIIISLTIFMTLYVYDRLSRLFHWHWSVRPIIIFITGFILGMTQLPNELAHGIIMAILMGISLLIVTKLVIRKHLPFIPLITGFFSTIYTLKQGLYQPFSGALTLYLISAVLIFSLSLFWYLWLVITNWKTHAIR